MKTRATRRDISTLVKADDHEMLALLGCEALPIVTTPAELLAAGRGGLLWQAGPMMLGREESPTASRFWHEQMKDVGRRFLQEWSQQLHIAICGNRRLYAKLQGRGIKEIDVMVGAAAGAIVGRIPELAPFTGLVTVLGVMVAKTGIAAFCESLATPQQPASSQTPAVKRARAPRRANSRKRGGT